MKITLVGHGTRGDVQPSVCLGFELQKRGHEVTLSAPENMRAFAERAGLRVVPTPVDAEALLNAPEARKLLATGRFLEFLRWLEREDARNREPLQAAFEEAARGADALVSHVLADDSLAALGAAFRIPVLPLYFYPVLPTRELPQLFVSARNLGPLNALSHKLFLSLAWKTAAPAANALRRRLGVPAATTNYGTQALTRGLPIVVAYGKHLVPRPSDWPASVISCDAIAPPPELKAALGEQGLAPDVESWLREGSSPVYLGFGSMPVLEPERMLDTLETVLQRLELRAVLSAGWSRFAARRNQRLLTIGAIDHAALFARCRAAVHHGGAGTTYATARAGLPTLVCSVFADQPFWGRTLEKLGVGAHVPFQKLDARRLERGLARILDPRVTSAARDLGRKLSRENGLREVADAVERALPRMPPPL